MPNKGAFGERFICVIFLKISYHPNVSLFFFLILNVQRAYVRNPSTKLL